MNGKSPILFPAEALEHLSDEEFWNYAHQRAVLSPTEAETHPEEYLRCQLSHGECLIPLAALYGAMLPPQGAGKGHLYTLLPATPAWMVGLFAWRGEAIAVIDLDAYLVSRNDPGSALPGVVHFFARKDEAIMPSEAMARTQKSEPHPMLLMADCSDLAIGLLVSAVALTTSGHTCPPDRVPQGIAPTIHEAPGRQPETTSGRPQGIAPTIHEAHERQPETTSGRPQGIAPTIHETHERLPETTSGRPQGIAPTIHETHERLPEYSGRPGLPVLDLPTILADVVQQIRDACPP